MLILTNLSRLFLLNPDLSSGQKVILDVAKSHYLLHVLRLQIDNSLVVFNNSGGEFFATISAVHKNKAQITLGEFIAKDSESPLRIHLGQGISRGEKMDLTIQKATELGVNTITPLFTERCNVKLVGERLQKKMQHWQNVAISAAEQSGRCYVPEILPAQFLKKWDAEKASGLYLVLDPNASNKIGDIEEKPNRVTILVGPEGGLSSTEIKESQQKKFLPTTLGPRILRTETAALAMISILQSKWGDF